MNAPLPPKKPDNNIDHKEAELIGDFFVTVGRELTFANNELRTDVLENADKGFPLEYYWVDEAEAEYRMALTVGKREEGSGRKRESEVLMKARFKRTASQHQHAPFNVLNGVISPAERNRREILGVVRSSNPTVDFSPHCPILHLGGDKFLLVEGYKNYYVVELGAQETARLVLDLAELTNNLSDMFRFLESQLKGTISGS